MKENKNKKSQLVWDPKIARKLLKQNGEIKYCPFCGVLITENCDCHKNIIIDSKPYRNSEGVIEPNRSVSVFHNNEKFQADYNQFVEEAKAKREAETELEPLSIDLD